MLLKDFSGNPFPAVGEERDREAGFGPWREHRTAQSVGHLRRDTNGRKQAQDNGDWGLSRELWTAESPPLCLVSVTKGAAEDSTKSFPSVKASI
uniref:Uncharacterized protein n=1 Tax=Vespula pensylvanica TaxID=30213 RepID=A0A834UE55_VESPE|nr:hypothetical protein H0235_002418 [Vespula pensylvanica]